MKTFQLLTAVLFISLFSLSTNLSAQHIADNELKKGANPLSQPLAYITQLAPISYEYDTDKFKKFNLPEGLQYGFIAEDVQQAIPGIVKTEGKLIPSGKNSFSNASVKSIDMESLIPILVGAVKEQQQEINKLKSELESLKVKNTSR